MQCICRQDACRTCLQIMSKGSFHDVTASRFLELKNTRYLQNEWKSALIVPLYKSKGTKEVSGLQCSCRQVASEFGMTTNASKIEMQVQHHGDVEVAPIGLTKDHNDSCAGPDHSMMGLLSCFRRQPVSGESLVTKQVFAAGEQQGTQRHIKEDAFLEGNSCLEVSGIPPWCSNPLASMPTANCGPRASQCSNDEEHEETLLREITRINSGSPRHVHFGTEVSPLRHATSSGLSAAEAACSTTNMSEQQEAASSFKQIPYVDWLNLCVEAKAACESPYMLTIMSADEELPEERTLYQNPVSKRYYGDLAERVKASGSSSGHTALDVVRELFQLEGEELLRDMAQVLVDDGDGARWCRVMRVLPSLLQQQVDHEVSDLARSPDTNAAAAATLKGRPASFQGSRCHTARRASSYMPSSMERASQPDSVESIPRRRVTRRSSCVLLAEGLAGADGLRRCNSSKPQGLDGIDVLTSRDSFSMNSRTFSASATSIAVRNAPRHLISLVEMTMNVRNPMPGGQENTINSLNNSSSNISPFKTAPCNSAFANQEGGSPLRDAAQDMVPPQSERIAEGPSGAQGPVVADVSRSFMSEETGQTCSSLTDGLSCRHGVSASQQIMLEHSQQLMVRSSLNNSGSGSVASLDQGIPDVRRWRSSVDLSRRSLLGLQDGPGGISEWGAQGDANSLDSRGSRGNASGDWQRDDPPPCWHEVVVKTMLHPVNGSWLIMIFQNDVTERTEMEMAMAKLTEIQLNMLCEIFPRHVIEYMSMKSHKEAKPDLSSLARSHQDVTILFMDIVGFTSMCKEVAPPQVMNFLNQLFSTFDDLAGHHNVQKVETAGDCYIVAAGIMSSDAEGFSKVDMTHDPKESAARVFAFAKDMMASSQQVLMPHDGTNVVIRIGIHTGPCHSGLIGSKLPKFSVFGDTMNTASRMESTSTPGRIQVSADTHALLMASGASSCHEWHATGGVQVKGKGLMETHIWAGSVAAVHQTSTRSEHSHGAEQAPDLLGLHEEADVGARASKLLSSFEHNWHAMESLSAQLSSGQLQRTTDTGMERQGTSGLPKSLLTSLHSTIELDAAVVPSGTKAELDAAVAAVAGPAGPLRASVSLPRDLCHLESAPQAVRSVSVAGRDMSAVQRSAAAAQRTGLSRLSGAPPRRTSPSPTHGPLMDGKDSANSTFMAMAQALSATAAAMSAASVERRTVATTIAGSSGVQKPRPQSRHVPNDLMPAKPSTTAPEGIMARLRSIAGLTAGGPPRITPAPTPPEAAIPSLLAQPHGISSALMMALGSTARGSQAASPQRRQQAVARQSNRRPCQPVADKRTAG